MSDLEIGLSTLADDVMRNWPATIRAFLDHRMSCPGCPIACFHTVADSCREHGVAPEVFLRDLRLITQAHCAEAGLSLSRRCPRPA